MSLVHTITLTVNTGGTPLTNKVLYNNDLETDVEVLIPAPQTDYILPVSFTAAKLNDFYFVSDQPVSLRTNGVGTDEIQSLAISGVPTGGTFVVNYGGVSSAPIPYNATAAQVQQALQAMSSIGAGNMICSGGPLPGTAVACRFTNLLGGQNVAQMTTTDSLTGGTTPASAVTTTTGGVAVGNVFTAIAKQPIIWGAGLGIANPFTADVTNLHVVLGGTVAANVDMVAGYNH